MSNFTESSPLVSAKGFIFTKKIIKPMIFFGFSLFLVSAYTLQNFNLIINNPNYTLPVVAILMGVFVGIKRRAYSPIYVGSTLGVVLTVAVPQMVLMASKLS